MSSSSPPFDANQLRIHLPELSLHNDISDQTLASYRWTYNLNTMHNLKTSCMGRIEVGSYDIVAQMWWPAHPKATLVIMHGYFDHMGLYRHIIDWALQHNLVVIGCDLPGHGLSSGKRASIKEFSEYQLVLNALLKQAKKFHLPQPWHLLGQSTGGAILIDYLLMGKPAKEIGQTVLLAPLIRPKAWRRAYVAYQLLRPFLSSLPRKFGHNSGDKEFLTFIKNEDILQPRSISTAWVGALSRWIKHIEQAPRSNLRPLIIQGSNDKTVNWKYNLKVLNSKFENGQLLFLPKARHHLANETQLIRDTFLSVVQQKLRL